jgi:hypothetical protein
VSADLDMAQALAKRHNLLILAKRTSHGGIQNYRVFRRMSPNPVFLGERITERAVLEFVRKLSDQE